MIYGLASITSRLNLGDRHLLPMYPAAFILAGSVWKDWRATHRLLRGFVGFCLSALAIQACAAWPNYLAYFNEAVGGPANGWRYLVGSSLDWGQDLPGVAAWLEKHPEVEGSGTPVYLSYFGSGDPIADGIRARFIPRIPPANPLAQDMQASLEAGVYFISNSTLVQFGGPTRGPWSQARELRYQTLLARAGAPLNPTRPWEALGDDWGEFRLLRLARLCAFLRHRRPDDQIGFSINVYEISTAELAGYASSVPPGTDLHDDGRGGPK